MNEKVMTYTRARAKQEKYYVKDLFENPILHRQIQGDKVYTPLNKERFWGI
ncbi:hypothetical protein [Halalkalibacter urbisdiaboli]|uniref:hypothetical protein n=1 Tax=Halalkalibacter urbisdiaboli TaxID=1960589 RepID=UPI0013FD109B|nr:hypothetical protein [Halalkalibacter urbisdiaboli]